MRHLPNLITMLRMLLVAPLCWLIDDGRYGGALVVAAAAGLSDAIDGFLAKRFGWQSWLGGVLDPIADKLLMTAAFIWLALAGALPMWLAFIVVGRDVVIVIGACLYHSMIGRFDAAPSRLSKLTTVIQIAFVLVLLLHLSRWIEVTQPLLGILVGVTTALTIASGLHYLVVWGALARRTMEKRVERVR